VCPPFADVAAVFVGTSEARGRSAIDMGWILTQTATPTITPQGTALPPESRVVAAALPLKVKLMNMFCKSEAAANAFPSAVQVITTRTRRSQFYLSQHRSLKQPWCQSASGDGAISGPDGVQSTLCNTFADLAVAYATARGTDPRLLSHPSSGRDWMWKHA
jgi:hypothetical protein